ncbi:MAG: zinc ribbon domain-containing protein [Candidatus Limnocylindrales bacterium]|jgi:hypothetical protein
MTVTINCESCGMPLAGAQDHALSDASIPYCGYCAPQGKLSTVDERLERFTQWTMRQEGLDYTAAREKARAYMKTMPAWKDAL